MTPHSGTPGPSLINPVELSHVRVAGWATHPARQLPMHSKSVVLGVTTYFEDDEMFAGDVSRFNPLVSWMGSANWTTSARNHVERGL